jgi:hypothetical protein
MIVPNLERAVVEVFGGCNYKCQMCPQTTGRGKDWTRKMPLDMFEDIVDQSYDNILDDDARLEKIFEILERLSVGIDLDRVKNMLPLRILRNQLLLKDTNYWLNYIRDILFDKR